MCVLGVVGYPGGRGERGKFIDNKKDDWEGTKQTVNCETE
jgi:hypothetical protein